MSPAERVDAEDEIAREILAVHEESYGTGASAIHAHVLEDFTLVVVDVTLTRAEETMLDAGKKQAVTAMREAFQEAIGATFIAIVERATGRRVGSFSSYMDVDASPMYSVELFRHAPH
jgi:uncharacterized protein YbcI